MDISSYPRWAQEMVDRVSAAKKRVVGHEVLWRLREGRLDRGATHSFLAGLWPTIEQFPQYMALNLLKVEYGRSPGHDLARAYLIRNIRAEQKRADYWIDWAEAAGVSRATLVSGSAPKATRAQSQWCWHICQRGSLAAGLAATSYAIGRATGEWALLVCAAETYRSSFPPDTRVKAMRWLKAHAQCDDSCPWEALEIICTILGVKPSPSVVAELESVVRKSYESMATTLDDCLAAPPKGALELGVA
jgi:pyrroloquinoline quinone (PQQ) biosynthesis protein C